MKTGITLATFRSVGKIPVDRERLKIWARGKEMKGATCFTTEGLMSSKPELLPFLKVAMISKISCLWTLGFLWGKLELLY